MALDLTVTDTQAKSWTLSDLEAGMAITDPDRSEAIEPLGFAEEKDPSEPGVVEPGPRVMPYEGIGHYFRGAKFATLALRGRHRDLGQEFSDDTKRYIQMVGRYLEALPGVEERKA